jgi:hypothetical protein
LQEKRSQDVYQNTPDGLFKTKEGESAKEKETEKTTPTHGQTRRW